MSVTSDVTSEQAEDVADPQHHEEVRGDDRVIVVNSQPGRTESELPPRRLKSLGSVSSHATDPVSGDGQPRRGGRRGNPLLSLLLFAVPLALAGFGIAQLDARTPLLAATAALAAVWLVGIVAAWRALGPGGRDGRSAVWLGRAIGLVLGAVAAVYLLLDPVAARL